MSLREPTPSEQYLVSLLTEIAISVKANRKHWKKKSHDDLAAWVSAHLAAVGYHSTPMGMEWTYLTKVDTNRDTK